MRSVHAVIIVLFGNIMNGLRNVVHVPCRNTRHGNSTIGCAINMVVIPHLHHLILGQATVGKHTNLKKASQRMSANESRI